MKFDWSLLETKTISQAKTEIIKLDAISLTNTPDDTHRVDVTDTCGNVYSRWTGDWDDRCFNLLKLPHWATLRVTYVIKQRLAETWKHLIKLDLMREQQKTTYNYTFLRCLWDEKSTESVKSK